MEVERVKKHMESGHTDCSNRECNFCSNTFLKDLRYPTEKVNRLFIKDFMHMKHNRPETEEDMDRE